MISICFTYFRSLTLANLRAALFSIRQMELARVKEIVVIDNNTEDSLKSIQAEIDALAFSVPVRLYSYKHGDPGLTHSWSSNEAVRHATAPWIFFCRADYLLHSSILTQFVDVVEQHKLDWNGFVTAHGYHLDIDVAACEAAGWRESGVMVLRHQPGAVFDYTNIDAGVWMARRDAFNMVHGLNESLTAWGHAQTHFQYKMHATGCEFVKIPTVLFYHPQHSAHRDIAESHQQLAAAGIDLKELWQRYEGVKPY